METRDSFTSLTCRNITLAYLMILLTAIIPVSYCTAKERTDIPFIGKTGTEEEAKGFLSSGEHCSTDDVSFLIFI